MIALSVSMLLQSYKFLFEIPYHIPLFFIDVIYKKWKMACRLCISAFSKWYMRLIPKLRAW